MYNRYQAPRATGVLYAEASYFDGYAFQHIAAWEDEQRIKRARNTAIRAFERRSNHRGHVNG